MRPGDLVKYRLIEGATAGIVIDLVQKKVARVGSTTRVVRWNEIEPEPHAVVLWSHNDGTIDIPISELTLITNGSKKR